MNQADRELRAAIRAAVAAGMTTRRSVREYIRARGLSAGNAKLGRLLGEEITQGRPTQGVTRKQVQRTRLDTLVGPDKAAHVRTPGMPRYRYVVEVEYIPEDEDELESYRARRRKKGRFPRADVVVSSSDPLTKRQIAEAAMDQWGRVRTSERYPLRGRIIRAVVRYAVYNEVGY